jgi:hypothetical protein
LGVVKVVGEYGGDFGEVGSVSTAKSSEKAGLQGRTRDAMSSLRPRGFAAARVPVEGVIVVVVHVGIVGIMTPNGDEETLEKSIGR